MLDELEAAANRGVRVRLLLDDNGIAQLDGRLATLDLHAHVEVRLYNSFHIRKPKALNWLFKFNRLNPRATAVRRHERRRHGLGLGGCAADC